MEIEEEGKHRLSKKTRGILFSFKTKLNNNKLTLKNLVVSMFEFLKEKFRYAEFTAIIKKIDDKLNFNQIDSIIQQLDSNGNGFIFFNQFEIILNQINQKDDPFVNQLDIKSSILMEKSTVRKLTEQQTILILLKQIKDRLKDTQPYEILDLMDYDRDGSLSLSQFQQFLTVLEIKKQNHFLILKHIMKNQKKISFKEIMSVLNLQQMGKRINFEFSQDNKSILLNSSMSTLFKKQTIQNNSMIKSSSKIKYHQAVDIVPAILEPYFNPSSKLQEPLTSLAVAHLIQNSYFLDNDNPKSEKAVAWLNIKQIIGKCFLFEKSSLIKSKKGELGQIMEAKNIIQGNQGDCYFLSAIAGLAEKYPELIYRLFVLQMNPAYIFGIRLFIDGMWQTIITDAQFPVNHYGSLICAKPHRSEIWGILLEKAWAKVYKSYENINAGYTSEGLTAITGAPCYNEMALEPGTIQKLKIYYKKGYIISCSSSDIVGQMTPRQQQNLGIFSYHAYSVLSIETRFYNGRQIILLKIRNPWGRGAWKGDWSAGSKKWNPQLRKLFSYEKDLNDGSFYMSIDDFMIYFQRITICLVSLGKQNSHIKIESHRNHSKMVRFTVKTAGDYFFSIYQENKRKHKNSPNYELSKSRIFLGRVNKGKIEAIASKTDLASNLHLQTTLEPGEYIISTKIKWKYFQVYSYILTSYGPQLINFEEIPKDKSFLVQFIESKAAFELGQKDFYTQYGLNTSYKTIYMNPSQGYGYILIRNNSQFVFQTTIKFAKIRGIKNIKPNTFPIKLYVVPYSVIVRGFLVDPEGYNLQFKESVKFS